jgi:hypothetical protein
MQLNRMYRTFPSSLLSIALPAAVLAFLVLGIQSISLVSQLYFSIAAVAFVFSALVWLPSFFEQHARMRALIVRRNQMVSSARRFQQRTMHYTLNNALRQHQLRGRGLVVPAFSRLNG